MLIEIAVDPGAPHQVSTAAALLKGFARHGMTAEIVAPSAGKGRAQVVVCWGWRNSRVHRNLGKRVLVMEQGYVGERLSWLSLAWDGLNGRGRFPKIDDDGRRWRRHFAEHLRNLPRTDCYALVLGQVSGDVAITGVDITKWYAEAMRRLADHTDLPVFFRAHPVEVERRGTRALSACAGAVAMNGTLERAFSGAAAVAAYNSNSLTDAALAGVPVLAGDTGAMAWPVAGQGLDDEPKLVARAAWAARLAWCQWSLDEIAAGEAWEACVGAMEPGSGWSPSRETRSAAAA